MAVSLAWPALLPYDAAAERVVILHTNDTHSQIDPDRRKGTGGILRRKALIDSVRNAEPNVIVVDAGDAVQGTLYYTLFGGEVEQEMLNELGYDVQIMGNHEFDNGMEALAYNYRNARATTISANTTFDGTPLEGLLQPYVVKQVGNRRIGFIGININPDGLISPAKSKGVKYNDGVEVLNRLSRRLKDVNKVDAVVAVTHIGYSGDKSTKGYTDIDLARLCPDIDAIIGGHSHTLFTPGDPRTKLRQSDGDTVLVVQSGKGGDYIGEVIMDFDSTGHVNSSWSRISVDKRLDSRLDTVVGKVLAPYRHEVDSVYNIPVIKASDDFSHQAMMNFASDFVRERGSRLVKGRGADLAIMNKGGIRKDFSKGTLTRGDIIDVFPFDNRVVVVDVPGDSLLSLFDIMARQSGQGLSSNVKAVISPDKTECESVTIDGKPIVRKRIYRVATIDYLAEGGDSMSPLINCRRVVTSNRVLYDDIIDMLSRGKSALSPDSTIRMK